MDKIINLKSVVPLYLPLFLQGMYSQFVQVILIRELITRFSGTEAVAAVVICSAILWTAIGCIIAAKIKASEKFITALTFFSLIFSPLSALAVYAFSAVGTPLLVKNFSLSYPFDETTFFSFLAPAFFGLVNGMVFGLILRTGGKANAGKTYAVDAFGSALGGILFTIVLANFAAPLAVLGVSGLAIAVSSIFLIRKERKTLFINSAAIVFASTLCVYCSFKDNELRYSKWKNILPSFSYAQSIETPSGRIDLLNRGGFDKKEEPSLRHVLKNSILEEKTRLVSNEKNNFAIYKDGFLIGTVPAEKEFALPAAMFTVLQADRKELDALLIVSPFSPLPEILLKTSLISGITFLCPSEKLFSMARDLKIIPESPDKFKAVFEDGRVFLERNLKSARLAYDLIIVLDREPESLESNRYFTKEFYRLVSKNLKPDGVFVTSMPSFSGYGSECTNIFNACISATLNSVFKNAVFAPGEVKLIAAGNAVNITADFAELDKRLERLTPNLKDFPPGIMSVVFSQSEQKNESADIANFAKSSELNSDKRPLLPAYFLGFYSRMVSGNVEKPGIFFVLIEYIFHNWLLITAVLLLIYISIRLLIYKTNRTFQPRIGEQFLSGNNKAALGYFSKFRNAGLEMTSFENGFYAMGIEILLLFIYQNRCGALYQDIAAAIAIFIAGTAFGSLILRKKYNLFYIKLLSLAAFILPVFILYSANLDFLKAKLAIFILLFISGLATGFAYTLLNLKHSSEKSGNRIWIFEMCGAAAGGLFLPLILLPAGGLLPCAALLCLSRVPLTLFSLSKQ